MKKILLTVAICFCSSLNAFAFLSGNKTEKSQYHIFNPTPENKMRELSTDRPDKTESPYSVDAGHFQFETDLLTLAMDGDDRTYTWNLINMKMGLLSWMDLQVVVENYVHQISDEGTKRGFGDVTLRLKNNLIGNDEGDFAFGIMPYIKLPTNSAGLGNKNYEGGMMFPFAASLPKDWGLGAMLQLDLAKDSDESAYHIDYVTTYTMGHDIVGDLAFYAELFSALGENPWVATFDAGLTYGLNKNWQLDAGVNIGLTDAADDFNPFIGLTGRI